MKAGENFYKILKKNNITVWIVSVVAVIVMIGSLLFSWMVYQQSTQNIYTISNNGELIPLRMLEEKQADQIQAKANIEYFISQYYNLDAYSMKTKRERVYWLLGKQPTQIIKDRANKGYFDNFLSMAGLTQNAQLMQNSLQISKESPYTATFKVRIQRVNGGISEWYNSNITLQMERVNRNYPYNPYGLLITQFSESLEKIADPNSDEQKEEEKASDEIINQNPTTDESK